MFETINVFLKKHLFKCLGGVLGLTVAILFLTIGFFQTMLLVLLLAIGVFLGARLDRTEGVRGFMEGILSRKRDDDPFG